MTIQSESLSIVKELVSTPNGQVRLWGVIVSGGAAFGAGFGIAVDPLLILGSFVAGVIFILISIWMADRRAGFESRERRDQDRPATPVSDRTMDFCKLITRPMEQHQVAQIPYKDDDQLTHDDAIRKLKILRAKEGASGGADIYWINGKFYPRTDQTVIAATRE